MAGNIANTRMPDEDRGPIISTALWTFTATATVLQLGRLWSRLKLRSLGWDDYWMFFTTALLAAFAVVVQINMDYGGGRHLYHLVTEGEERLQLVAKLSWVSQPFCIMALGTGKISVALLLLRFLLPSQKWLRWSLWFCLITVNLALATAVLLTFLQCSPPSKLWNQKLDGTCWPPTLQTNYSLFASAYSAAADLYLAYVPLTVVWRLQMKMEKRIGLCIIFGLGVVAGACGFYKTSKIPGIASRNDVTWDSYDALLFTGSEIWLVIVCGTIPTIKPLWTDLVALFGCGSKRRASKSRNPTGKGSTVSPDSSFASKPDYRARITVQKVDDHDEEDDYALHEGKIRMHHTVDVRFSNKEGAV